MKSFTEKLCSFILIFGTVLLFSACEIRKKGARDPNNTELNKAAVESFFLIEQAAISNPEYQQVRAALSSLVGRALVVSDESSFKNWYDPQKICMNEQADNPEVALVRELDVGDLTIQDPSGSKITLPKDPQGFYFIAEGLLNPGNASLSTSGSQGSFLISHNFKIPDMGSQIEFENISTGDREKLPSPQIVAQPASGTPDSENYYVVLNRSAAYRVSYQAPANTNFVRIAIRDNSKRGIVCYGEAAGDMMIPAGALEALKATNEAQLTVDFVNIDVRKDIPRMKESLVKTYSRHYHGRLDTGDALFIGSLTLQ